VRKKTIMVIDHGLYLYLAVKLSQFYEVLYYVPNIEPYPETNKDDIGTGIPGIERVYDLFKYIKPVPSKADKVDLFCFFDVGLADLQAQLKEMGYRVFGSGNSAKLEQDKWFFNEVLKKVGLPTVGMERITGVDALRAHLEKVQDKYIKVGYYRGSFETYHHVDMWDTETWLDDLVHRIGMKKQDMVFLVQDPIKSVIEIGYDGFNVNGNFPQNCITGIEGKDEWYIGMVSPDPPRIVQHVNDKFSPVLRKMGYNGFYSTEVRIEDAPYSKDFQGKPYYNDLTARVPSPPGEGACEMYEDLGTVIWQISEGKVPELKQVAKYLAILILTSPWYEDHWLRVKVPDNSQSWLKLKNYCIKDGQHWCIPNKNGAFFGAVIATGNSLEKTIELVSKRAEQVKAYEIQYNKDAECDMMKAIADAKKVGIFF
jgi:hypothetical protein